MAPICMWEAEICARNLEGDTGPLVITGATVYAEKLSRILVGECHKVQNSAFTGVKRHCS